MEEEDYAWAAQELGCDVCAVKAVAEVESKGNGLLADGRPKILFEAHHFSKFTAGKYDRQYPSISSPSWNRKLYVGGEGEHVRLETATKLDRDSALKSCSWGRFQIMGFNWKACGFTDLQSFVNAMYSEQGQLKAFVGFIKALRLQDDLRDLNWKHFARQYNGPGYQQNDYDGKLRRAFAKCKGVPM